MSNDILVAAEPRTSTGSRDMGRLRRSGKIPAVVYGAEREPANLQLNTHDFEQLLRHYASETMMVTLQVEGQGDKRVLLKSVQHHPVDGAVLHADFQEVSMTETLRVALPIELEGTPAGVEQEGGLLEQLVTSVEVECLPGDILDLWTVDVSHLNIMDQVTVGDLQLDTDKYTLWTDPEVAIATVQPPRSEEEEEEEAEAAEPGEVEVIGEKKDEDEEGETPDE